VLDVDLCLANPVPDVPLPGAYASFDSTPYSNVINLWYGPQICDVGPLPIVAGACNPIDGSGWSILMGYSACCTIGTCLDSNCNSGQTVAVVADYLKQNVDPHYTFVNGPITEALVLQILASFKPFIIGVEGPLDHMIGIIGVTCGNPNSYYVDDPRFGHGWKTYEQLLTYATAKWTVTVYPTP